MRNLTTELKVGVLILAGLTLIVSASVVVTGWRPGQGGTYKLFVYFDNVSGLLAQSPVNVAGVKIGQIKSIELAGSRARVELQILNKFAVHADAQATIRSLGVLGDKYIELTLGSDSQPMLVEGDTIVAVSAPSDLDTLIVSLSGILADVKSVTSSLNTVLGGEKGEQRLDNIMEQIQRTTSDLSRITAATNSQIDIILANIKGFTGALDRMTTTNETNVQETLKNLKDLTGELRELAVQNRTSLDRIITNLDTFSGSLAKDGPVITDNLRGLLTDNRQALNNTIANLDRSFSKLDSTMGNLKSITDKMDKGQGTIGKLLNDETTVDQLNSALVVINRYLTDLDRIKLDVGVETDYLQDPDNGQGSYKTYLSVYVQPLKDRTYIIQLVDNPRGDSHTTTTTTTQNGTGTLAGTQGTGTLTQTQTKTTDALQVSLLLAQRYFDTVLKGGLMEDHAGVGIEQYFGSEDAYRIGLDVWDFSNDLGPHVKLSAYWRFYSNAFMVVGGDDLASKNPGYHDAFFGVGVRFNEDSLKPIASSLPVSSLVR
jgi:phospholipid/cholesterol/gamma-HCH transport system substrate-binding protein